MRVKANKATREDLAAAHGLTHVGSVRDLDRKVVGVHLSWTPKNVVEFSGEPYVQIANHGWKYGLGGGDFKPSRRGFIAVRHQLRIPDMYVASHTTGATTAQSVATSVVNVASVLDLGGSDSTSALRSFARRCEELEVPEQAPFKVLCLKDRLEEGRALLTPQALELIEWLAQSFDVEWGENWLLVYNAFGDVSTEDPEVWEWVLSVASRLGDLLTAWGDPRDFAAAWPWYVQERVERPASLDGPLRFLKRKK